MVVIQSITGTFEITIYDNADIDITELEFH